MDGQIPTEATPTRFRFTEWIREDGVRPPSRLRSGIRFWIQVFRQFLDNRGPVRASALAYTTLLALVPLLAISLSAAALFLPKKEDERKEQLLSWIEEAVKRAAPTLGLSADDGSDQREKVAAQIVTFVERIHFKTIGAAATAGLLVVAIGLLRTVELTFNDIWGVTRNRRIGVSVIYYWAFLTLGPVVLLVAKGANYLRLLDSTSWAPPDSGVAPLLILLSYGVAPGLMCLVFSALYWSMPNTRVPWQAALVGGVAASTLWTLNGMLSALYNTRILTNNAIYGSLGVLPMFLVGIYINWLVILFGAQVGCVFQYRKRNPGFASSTSDGASHPLERETLAVRLMTRIATGFAAGSAPMTSGSLASFLNRPPGTTLELLERLVQAGLLVETSQSNAGYTPARALDRISVRDILHAVRPPADGWHSNADSNPSENPTWTAIQAVTAAGDSAAEGFTLDQLARDTRIGREKAGGLTSRNSPAVGAP